MTQEQIDELAKEYAEQIGWKAGGSDEYCDVHKAFKAGYAAAPAYKGDEKDAMIKRLEKIIEIKEAERMEWADLCIKKQAIIEKLSTPTQPNSVQEGEKAGDMTVEDFYSGFNLDFLTDEEKQTIYTATELYAKGKMNINNK